MLRDGDSILIKRIANKAFIWFFISILVSPISYGKEDKITTDLGSVNSQISKLTHQMIIEVLIEDREEMKYSIRSEKEIRNVLNQIFGGKEVMNIETVKQKILKDFDDLNCSFFEEIRGYEEYTKTATLYYILLGLLSGYHGSVTYIWDLAEHSLYYSIDDEEDLDWNCYILDSYLTLEMTRIYLSSQTSCNMEEEAYIRCINSFLLKLERYAGYDQIGKRFQKYRNELRLIVDELVRDSKIVFSYEVRDGDGYWALAKHVLYRSGLDEIKSRNPRIVNELAAAIEKDLKNNRIGGLETGQVLELRYIDYYLPHMIHEKYIILLHFQTMVQSGLGDLTTKGNLEMVQL